MQMICVLMPNGPSNKTLVYHLACQTAVSLADDRLLDAVTRHATRHATASYSMHVMA